MIGGPGIELRRFLAGDANPARGVLSRRIVEVHALADARVNPRSRDHAHAGAVRLVIAGVPVSIGVVFPSSSRCQTPTKPSVLLKTAFESLMFGALGCPHFITMDWSLLLPLTRSSKTQMAAEPAWLVPQLDRVWQRLACRVEEPDVGAVRARLIEIEAALVEQHGQRIAARHPRARWRRMPWCRA